VDRWLRALVLLAAVAMAAAAHAQSLESVLAPGRLIQGHAKWEDECRACHVPFDRQAQDGLCMDCHKDIGQNMRARTGMHGRLKPQPCHDCHTDHKGRHARIAAFDTSRFDHAQTDFALRGKHRQADCAKCHEPARKYSAAATDCNACHRKDDVHKGSLGPKCADCHTENNWKEAKFDHGTTRFALTGKHADTKCDACHKVANFKDTPRTCIACHRKDDNAARGHQGRFGEKCESCHTDRAWKPSTFNHDTDTKYTLRGKHRSARCGDCHTAPLYKAKLASDCWSCHQKDDKHKESLGRDCGSCHTERDWKERAKFDHDRTDFPLLGRHAETTCDACHKSKVFNEAPTACVACHRQDDKHEGTLGTDCGACHGERDWKTTRGRFDHERTRFKLRNAHAAPTLKCSACHRDAKSFRPTPLDCYSCHRQDDKHEGQLGRQCESCHGDSSWKVARFDHTRTRFPLLGRHVVAGCKDCHRSARYQDAPRDCIGCHKKDDKHKQALGEKCESCHNARAWSLWDFDHDRRSRYRLDGAHRQVACAACHVKPAPAGQAYAPLPDTCAACHRKDDVHDGAFGARCEQCHVTERWKKVTNRVLRTGGTP
jgi:hypothetical protein